MIKADLKRRLKELQKRAGLEKKGRSLRIWPISAESEKEADMKIKEIKMGKVLHPIDGLPFSEEEMPLFIAEMFFPRLCPGFDFNEKLESKPQSLPPEDPEAQLIREIEELKARKRKHLKAQKMRQNAHKRKRKK